LLILISVALSDATPRRPQHGSIQHLQNARGLTGSKLSGRSDFRNHVIAIPQAPQDLIKRLVVTHSLYVTGYFRSLNGCLYGSARIVKGLTITICRQPFDRCRASAGFGTNCSPTKDFFGFGLPVASDERFPPRYVARLSRVPLLTFDILRIVV